MSSKIKIVIDPRAEAEEITATPTLADWVARHDGDPIVVTLSDRLTDEHGRTVPTTLVGEIRGDTVYVVSAKIDADAIVLQALGFALTPGADLAVPARISLADPAESN